jgi:hypothetical protein
MMLLNAFSANMLVEFPVSVRFTEISSEEARVLLLTSAEAEGETEMIRSAVGHADTAAIFSSILGIPVPCNRTTVTMVAGDSAVVGQYTGPRLSEGRTTLPEGANVKWLVVEVGE